MPPIGPSKSNFHLAADPVLSKVREHLEAMERNSIRLWPEAGVDEEIPIGTTKLGGKPDLPPDMAWPWYHIERNPWIHERSLPEDGNVSVPFIGQFDLEDLAPFDADQVLPKTGMLYIFYNDIHYTSASWEMTEKIQVFHRQVDKKELTRREFPQNLPIWTFESLPLRDIQAYKPCTLQYSQERMLPKGEDWWVGSKGRAEPAKLMMTNEEYLRWGRLNYEFRQKQGCPHHLLGYMDLGSHWVQVPQELFPLGAPIREMSDEEFLVRGQDHRLLLQLDDSIGKLMGFDGGRTVYFCLREQDLARGDFSRVWVDIA